PGMLNDWTATVTSDAIRELANEDGVQWMEEVPPPETTFNDGSRNRVGANIVQAPPYNLDGTNVQVGVWDGGEIDNSSSPHPDLTGRVTIIENAPISDHATHVTGTMMGDGSASGRTYRGMATSATAYSYTFLYNDLEPEEHNGAINTYGIDISQNSWGVTINEIDLGNCDQYGNYSLRSQKYDNVVSGCYGRRIPIIFAAGNERNDGDCGIPARGGYACLPGPGATAKNTIVVGATNSDTDSMTFFSSWGPTDDGRIKPDVVAPGDEVGGNGDIWSTIPFGSTGHSYPYDSMIGTSMAAPCVSGCAALMIQDYRNTHNNVDPWPSTIKALLIHTATDLNNTGPDYTTGYGRINVQDAVDMIRDDAACCNVIIENNISANGEMDDYTIDVPAGTSELKVSLVWTDKPGTPNDAKELVNDLDLIVKDPNGVRKYPWTLNSSSPANAAERNKRDDINNVEQVYVNNPLQGTWNITVEGTTVPNPIQNYSLVGSLPMKEEDMTDVEWSIEKGLCWLYQNQNPDGSWGGNVGYTSLAALAFLNHGVNESDPSVSKAINYILSKKHADGSIYVGYSNYETSLAILPLVATHNNSYDADILAARNYLVSIQNDESQGYQTTNPFYGGWGYSECPQSSCNWSDLSNTQWTMMGLDAANLQKTDSTWNKAETFVTRCQNLDANPWHHSNDGGFGYQPPTVSCCGRHISYGSMTTAGIWGLRLAEVPTGNQRVQGGLNWLKNNYAPIKTKGNAQNPNYPGWYLYYYLLGFAKTLIMTGIPAGSWQETASKDITNYIVDQQYDDGRWSSNEGDVFATEQAILALQTRTIPTSVQRLSWLTFILHSNADLHVYDPLGRHVGKNYETGGIDLEIPNATYMSNGAQNIVIPGLETGNYRIVLIGTGTGEYTLDVTGGVGNDTVSTNSFTGNITEGEAHDADVNVAMITWLTIHIEEPEPVDAMVESATGTGKVSFVSDAAAGTIEDLTALKESDLPEENSDLDFPHGLFEFNITGLTPGETVTVTIDFPQNIPTTAQYWKYHTPQGWYQLPTMGSNDGDNIITIQLTDGGIGDDDGVANGVIVDQGGPGLPKGKADLTLSPADISFSPASQPTEGDSVTITATVHNIGAADATNFVVSFFDGVVLIGTETISVTASSSSQASTTWTATPAGEHTIKVVADSGGAVAESNEANNEASKK
ncbi:MAG: hypothetical protein DRH12_16680, partial [Deltaproteobacteria bacterium]